MRYITSFFIAAGISLALFILMNYLISGGRDGLQYVQSYSVVDFVRLRKEETTDARQRSLPKKPPPPEKAPAPPSLKVATPQSQPFPDVKLSVDKPDITGINLKGSLFLGNFSAPAATPGTAPGIAISEGEAVPIIRIAPQYPRRAAMRGIEGWVKLAFTISEDGTVRDVSVVEAKPKKVFNRAAIKALKKWKFKPRVVDGKRIPRQAEQVLEFNLAK